MSPGTTMTRGSLGQGTPKHHRRAFPAGELLAWDQGERKSFGQADRAGWPSTALPALPGLSRLKELHPSSCGGLARGSDCFFVGFFFCPVVLGRLCPDPAKQRKVPNPQCHAPRGQWLLFP